MKVCCHNFVICAGYGCELVVLVTEQNKMLKSNWQLFNYLTYVTYRNYPFSFDFMSNSFAEKFCFLVGALS